MKKFISMCSVLAIILSLAVPAFASEQETLISQEITVLNDDVTITDELYEISVARASTKEYIRKKTITYNGTTVGVIAIKGKFSYDGTTVSVVSKSVTQTDTSNSWNYKQNSFTSSGGTITLDAKLTKLLVPSIAFTITLSCDKNGNIS